MAMQDGLGSAFAGQPTAMLFVMVLSLSVVVSLFHLIRKTKTRIASLITPITMAIMVVTAAIINFGYQLNANA